MFIPDIPELEAKAGGLVVKAALVCLALVAAFVVAFRFRAQRDQARLQVQQLQLTIEGYRQVAAIQQQRLAQASAEAARRGEHHAAVLQDLQKDLPATDEEARSWALAAAKRLGR